jgi:hypothetical protein
MLQEHPGLRGTPLAMLAAQCNKLSSKSPPPLADAAVGKGFHPWKKTSSSSSSGNTNSTTSVSTSSSLLFPGGSSSTVREKPYYNKYVSMNLMKETACKRHSEAPDLLDKTSLMGVNSERVRERLGAVQLENQRNRWEI